MSIVEILVNIQQFNNKKIKYVTMTTYGELVMPTTWTGLVRLIMMRPIYTMATYNISITTEQNCGSKPRLIRFFNIYIFKLFKKLSKSLLVFVFLREAVKSFFLSGPTFKRGKGRTTRSGGGGGKDLTTKGNNFFKL